MESQFGIGIRARIHCERMTRLGLVNGYISSWERFIDCSPVILAIFLQTRSICARVIPTYLDVHNFVSPESQVSRVLPSLPYRGPKSLLIRSTVLAR